MSASASHVCRICGMLHTGPLYGVREMMYGLRNPFLYFQCSQCECLQITEIPGNIADYYPRQYYSFKKYDGQKFKGTRGKLKIDTYQASLTPDTGLRKIVHALFPTDHFKALDGITVTKESRILDVGCGNGDKYLYPLAEMGYAHVMGCDPYLDHDIHYNNGLTIRKTDVFGVDGIWDIILYHHSFEHVANPLENLQQVKRLLSPSGVCIISIPTVSSYAWEHYKTNWYQLDAPRHFFLHSLKSMDLLAEKTGLVVDHTVFDSDYKQFVISEQYERDLPMNTPRARGLVAFVKRKWNKVKYQRLALALNRNRQGDIANFYLKHS